MLIAEKVIIKALIADMAAAGFKVAAVWDGVEYQVESEKPGFVDMVSVKNSGRFRPVRGMTLGEAMSAISSVHQCTLHFTHKGALTWGNRGVLLILGNGEDVISDYHCGDPEFSAVVDAVYDRISDGTITELQRPHEDARVRQAMGDATGVDDQPS